MPPQEEIHTILEELRATKGELLDFRKERERQIYARLDKLDAGQLSIIHQIGQIELSYVTIKKMEELERRVRFVERIVYVGLGALSLANILLPVIIHFWKP